MESKANISGFYLHWTTLNFVYKIQDGSGLKNDIKY